MDETSEPKAKKARTNKNVPEVSSPYPPAVTQDIFGKQSATSVPAPTSVTSETGLNHAAVPGESILTKTMPTTGTSAAPLEAHAGALGGPTGRPLRRILPATSSLNLATAITLPIPLPTSQTAPTSGLGGSIGGYGTASALAQKSDPPDAFGQSWRSYLEAPSSQNVLKPPTASMSRVEGKKPEANIIRLPTGLPPGNRDGLEYIPEDLGFVIEESTTPPGSPTEILQAIDDWMAREQSNTASVEHPAPTTTQAASTINDQPHSTGLAPLLDPHAESTPLGRLLGQLALPALAAPAPSTTAPDSTFPEMQAAKKKSPGMSTAEQPNKSTSKASAPKRLKLNVKVKSKTTTAKAMTQWKAPNGKLTADTAALRTASQAAAASIQLPQTAPVTAVTTSTSPTAAIAINQGPTTRAGSTRAATARAATAPSATTQVATTQAAPAQAPAAPAVPTQAAPALPAATQANANTQVGQPAAEPRRSKRQNKGQRSTKREDN